MEQWEAVESSGKQWEAVGSSGKQGSRRRRAGSSRGEAGISLKKRNFWGRKRDKELWQGYRRGIAGGLAGVSQGSRRESKRSKWSSEKQWGAVGSRGRAGGELGVRWGESWGRAGGELGKKERKAKGGESESSTTTLS